MIKNKRGSVLVVTLGFILVFTMLGMASIYMATVQNEAAEKMIKSTEAFWLADGGIEYARSRIGAGQTGNLSSTTLGDGTYSFTVTPHPTNANQWIVDSTGLITNQTRKIEAIIKKSSTNNINDAVITEDTGLHDSPSDCGDSDPSTGCYNNIHCEAGHISCVQVNANFSFNSLLGLTESQVFTQIPPSQKYTNNDTQTYSVMQNQIILLTVPSNNVSVKINGQNPIQGSGFLIVDLRPANLAGRRPSIDFQSGTINGIIWFLGTGDINIKGTTIVNGTILNGEVNQSLDPKPFDIKGTVNENQANVNAAAGIVNGSGGSGGSISTIISWQEL